HAATLHAERAARPRARRHLDRHRRAVERRHLHLGAEGRLRERDRYRDREVGVTPSEQRVRFDARDDIEVAVRTTVATGCPAALQADPLPVADARRDADLHLTRPQLRAAALAGRTRLVDDHTTAAALRAHLTEREEALVL